MKGLESREVQLVYFALQDVKMICVHLIGLCVVMRGIDLHPPVLQLTHRHYISNQCLVALQTQIMDGLSTSSRAECQRFHECYER